MGYGAISLYTNELMSENIQLYKKLGYLETDRREDQGYRRVFMRKELSDRVSQVRACTRQIG